MTWAVVVLLLGAAVCIYMSFRKKRKSGSPDAFYVCKICGERDCDCHKVASGGDEPESK